MTRAYAITREDFTTALNTFIKDHAHRHPKVQLTHKQAFLSGVEWVADMWEDSILSDAAQAAQHRLMLEFYDD